jgi:hypothetical protein
LSAAILGHSAAILGHSGIYAAILGHSAAILGHGSGGVAVAMARWLWQCGSGCGFLSIICFYFRPFYDIIVSIFRHFQPMFYLSIHFFIIFYRFQTEKKKKKL